MVRHEAGSEDRPDQLMATPIDLQKHLLSSSVS